MAELEKLIDNIRWSEPNSVSEEVYVRDNDRQLLGQLDGSSIQVIIGDFIHNIRSALNYIAIGVWRFDSPKIEPSNRFQFPIESCQDEFLRKRRSTFKGISDKHIALFKRFQPCYGCDWTRLLVELSNKDKHWELVSVDLYINSSTCEVDAEFTDADDGSVQMDTIYEREITFSDETPVIEALEEIQTQVAHLFEKFNACLVEEYRLRITAIKAAKELKK